MSCGRRVAQGGGMVSKAWRPAPSFPASTAQLAKYRTEGMGSGTTSLTVLGDAPSTFAVASDQDQGNKLIAVLLMA